jgi:hypothetical protein
MWYKFNSVDDFNAWHANIKDLLGIPHPNANSATGKIDPLASWTLEYTEPIIVTANDIRVFIEEEYAEGLTLSEKYERQTEV